LINYTKEDLSLKKVRYSSYDILLFLYLPLN
jgi:hypothetical protein